MLSYSCSREYTIRVDLDEHAIGLPGLAHISTRCPVNLLWGSNWEVEGLKAGGVRGHGKSLSKEVGDSAAQTARQLVSKFSVIKCITGSSLICWQIK
jgi:hypothetical protein